MLSNEEAQTNFHDVGVNEEAPCPSNIEEVQDDVGLCTYYSKFISKF